MTGIIGLADKIFSQYGLIALVLMAVLVVTIWLVIRNVKRSEKREDRAYEKETKFIELINGFKDSIKDNTASLRELSRFNEEAHKYQKEEHEKMIATLFEIEKQQALNLKTAEGIEKAVARINGYKE